MAEPRESIEYSISLGPLKKKGKAKSVTEALENAAGGVTNFLYRGVADTLSRNAPALIEAISEYALQDLINKGMTGNARKGARGAAQVGIWTGSFLKSLDIKRQENSVSYTGSKSNLTLTSIIGIVYNHDMRREEQSGILLYAYGNQTVGEYGDYQMEKLAKFSTSSRKSFIDEVYPFFKRSVDAGLKMFLKKFTASEWSTSNVELRKLIKRTESLKVDNEFKIQQAAHRRIAEGKAVLFQL